MGRAPYLLVVDDDTDLREVVGAVLEDAGYEVSLARHGEEALRLVEDRRPDLILLDMKMPVMDGWEFARELRARLKDQLPTIVVLTAAENPSARAADIGAAGWLGKPFDIQELREEVARLAPLSH